jgi:hypothetical protein
VKSWNVTHYIRICHLQNKERLYRIQQRVAVAATCNTEISCCCERDTTSLLHFILMYFTVDLKNGRSSNSFSVMRLRNADRDNFQLWTHLLSIRLHRVHNFLICMCVCVSFMTPWYSRCELRYTTLCVHSTVFTIYHSLQHVREISPVNRATDAALLNCSVRAVTHLSSAAHDSEWLIIQEQTSAFNQSTNVRVEPDEALSYGPVPNLCLAL